MVAGSFEMCQCAGCNRPIYPPRRKYCSDLCAKRQWNRDERSSQIRANLREEIRGLRTFVQMSFDDLLSHLRAAPATSPSLQHHTNSVGTQFANASHSPSPLVGEGRGGVDPDLITISAARADSDNNPSAAMRIQMTKLLGGEWWRSLSAPDFEYARKKNLLPEVAFSPSPLVGEGVRGVGSKNPKRIAAPATFDPPSIDDEELELEIQF